jgi:hypothetical protein
VRLGPAGGAHGQAAQRGSCCRRLPLACQPAAPHGQEVPERRDLGGNAAPAAAAAAACSPPPLPPCPLAPLRPTCSCSESDSLPRSASASPACAAPSSRRISASSWAAPSLAAAAARTAAAASARAASSAAASCSGSGARGAAGEGGGRGWAACRQRGGRAGWMRRVLRLRLAMHTRQQQRLGRSCGLRGGGSGALRAGLLHSRPARPASAASSRAGETHAPHPGRPAPARQRQRLPPSPPPPPGGPWRPTHLRGLDASCGRRLHRLRLHRLHAHGKLADCVMVLACGAAGQPHSVRRRARPCATTRAGSRALHGTTLQARGLPQPAARAPEPACCQPGMHAGTARGERGPACRPPHRCILRKPRAT